MSISALLFICRVRRKHPGLHAVFVRHKSACTRVNPSAPRCIWVCIHIYLSVCSQKERTRVRTVIAFFFKTDEALLDPQIVYSRSHAALNDGRVKGGERQTHLESSLDAIMVTLCFRFRTQLTKCVQVPTHLSSLQLHTREDGDRSQKVLSPNWSLQVYHNSQSAEISNSPIQRPDLYMLPVTTLPNHIT